VELLIGAEIFFELLSVGQIKLGSHHSSIQKTSLVYIVSGKYTQQALNSATHLSVTVTDNISSFDSLVERFWNLEQVTESSKAVYAAEQVACEQHFKETVKRLASGRFEVKLPFKRNPNVLGLSFETAKRRFLALERKVNHDAKLHDMYQEFMKEYLTFGHMSLLPTPPPGHHYCIPHQCVLRPESSTTKMRVVFDASSNTSTSVSLNETLMVGPTIQRDLYAVLSRFRLKKYALTADISKMYRQVNVAEDDRYFQLILWREKDADQLQTYRLNTVSYGTAPAPCLAIHCLLELSKIY